MFSQNSHVSPPRESTSGNQSLPSPTSTQAAASEGRARTAVVTAAILLSALWASPLFAQRMHFPWPSSASSRGEGQNSRSTAMMDSSEQDMRQGGKYLVGNGVPRDPMQALYWYKKAADKGNAEAQNEVGYFYNTGLGVQRDPVEAAKWFTRAAGGGSQQGKLNLAVMYLEGIGVRHDVKFGIELLEQLAQKGNARAEDYLGVMYFHGYGVPEDHAIAEKWFEKSAKGKSSEGEFALATLYSATPGHEHNFPKAAKLLRKSAHDGYVPAMYSLGILLVNHPEVAPKPSDEAVFMLERSAEAGTWQSSAALGAVVRDGRGVPRDIGKAFRWFIVATKQGGAEAEKNTREDLAECRKQLRAEQVAAETEEAESWLQQHSEAQLYVFDDGFTIPARVSHPVSAAGKERKDRD